ncbi:U-box domain-containing protein 51-like isoform X2 [Asparagus officinalis]|uniref:U-box domain-containing protein 51-like isoform X2 n=1 Tax=Asparagus officinalis TaxID=4686 RepID=UPI00098E55C8|nr:U-box domain-containing protein 51-like isoform X2 [Asparagus officinalis]
MLRTSPSKKVQGASGKGEEDPQLVVVAVDKDKNSQHALKWAADHVIPRGYAFVLLHVRKRDASLFHGLEDEVSSADIETQELLTPFQCFCSRRALNCREVILNDMNIPYAINDFVLQHSVDKLVLGASSRSAFSRTFKQADVPSSVSKIAPGFCSVYVISKGKVSSSRPANCAKTSNFSGLATNFGIAANQFQSSKSEMLAKRHMDSPRRSAMINNAMPGHVSKNVTSCGYEQRNNAKGFHHPEEPNEFPVLSFASCPSPNRTSIDKGSSSSPRVLLDCGRQQAHLSASSNNGNSYLEEQTKSSDAYWTDTGSSGYKHSAHIASYGRADEEPPMIDRWSERRTTTKMNKKEEKRSRVQVAFEAGKAIDRENTILTKEEKKFSSRLQYKKYGIEEIKEVTNNFSKALQIGEGGYGPVFKSTLDQTPVAIKIPRPDVVRGVEQFQQEVEVLGSIHHPNLVQLMGVCPEYGCLVYEFMAKGNLEEHIFCRRGTAPLPWQLRFKIAAEIASALLYLHQTKPEPLVHRDLKPANILLDENFVSKITDVGLARLLPSNTSTCTSQYLATAAAGTFCYIDPEYQKTGTVGVKSDVYALGIILLQLITGRPPMGLAHDVENALEMGNFEGMLDSKVSGWPMEETMKLAKLGLMCAELRRRDRPDLGSVVLPELNRLRELADLSLKICGRI